MFADDCIIFCNANNKETRNIKEMNHYYKVSGQLFNYRRSCFLFSTGVSNAIKKLFPKFFKF